MNDEVHLDLNQMETVSERPMLKFQQALENLPGTEH